MKMGKSLGNTLEPKDLVQRFGSDAVRYFFLEVEFGNDGDYSGERFINVVNAHLANTIGNLLNGTLGLLKKNCQSTLAVDSTLAAEGNQLKDTVQKLVDNATLHYENIALSSACESVLEIGNAGNLYMDEQAPWSLFKQGGASAESAAKSDTRWGGLKAGQIMAEPKPIFARIEIVEEGEDEIPRKAVKSMKKISEN